MKSKTALLVYCPRLSRKKRLNLSPQTFMCLLLLSIRQKFYSDHYALCGWLGGRVVSVPDSGSEEHGFESQSRRCRVAV